MMHWFSKRSRLHAVLHFPKEHPSLLLPPAGSAHTHRHIHTCAYTHTHTHNQAWLSGWGKGMLRFREMERDSDGEGKTGLVRRQWRRRMQQKGGVDKIGRKRKKDGIEGMSRKKGPRAKRRGGGAAVTKEKEKSRYIWHHCICVSICSPTVRL